MREVETIAEVLEELGCYHWVYIYLYFYEGGRFRKKGGAVRRRDGS